MRNCCQINCSSVKQFSNYRPQKSHSKFHCSQLSLLYSHRFHSAHISLERKSKLPRCVVRSLELSKIGALSARFECGTFALLLSDVKSRLLLLLCMLLLLSCPLASFVAYNCLRFWLFSEWEFSQRPRQMGREKLDRWAKWADGQSWDFRISWRSLRYTHTHRHTHRTNK